VLDRIALSYGVRGEGVFDRVLDRITPSPCRRERVGVRVNRKDQLAHR